MDFQASLPICPLPIHCRCVLQHWVHGGSAFFDQTVDVQPLNFKHWTSSIKFLNLKVWTRFLVSLNSLSLDLTVDIFLINCFSNWEWSAWLFQWDASEIPMRFGVRFARASLAIPNASLDNSQRESAHGFENREARLKCLKSQNFNLNKIEDHWVQLRIIQVQRQFIRHSAISTGTHWMQLVDGRLLVYLNFPLVDFWIFPACFSMFHCVPMCSSV